MRAGGGVYLAEGESGKLARVVVRCGKEGSSHIADFEPQQLPLNCLPLRERPPLRISTYPPELSMTVNDVAISCYENEVPLFVEAELERLYGNIFSSLSQFRIYGWNSRGTSTYVVRRDSIPIVILLYRRDGSTVQVMNEVITLEHAEIGRFSSFVFERYSEVSVVAFKAIETERKRMPFPFQRYNHLEDMELDLPASVDAYFPTLGKSTRRNIRRHLDRIGRAFPSFRFEVLEREAMPPGRVREIIELNRTRMAGKNIESIIDEQETQRIIDLVKVCGLVGVVTIDGRLCAGAISFTSGQNYFLNVLAHDPRYDDYWLGFLCCYLTICESIARGGKEFHFLWGRYDYKYLLGARRRDLDNIVLYRSRLQLLRNADIARKIAVDGYKRAFKVWIKYGDSFLSQQARRLLERLRAWRKAAQEAEAESAGAFLNPSGEK